MRNIPTGFTEQEIKDIERGNLSNDTFTINKENVSNYLSVDNIDLDNEFALISPVLAKKSISINSKGNVFVGKDKIKKKMSKKGSLYYLIKNRYVSNRYLNRAINTIIYKASEPTEIIEMGSFNLVKGRTKVGAEVWFLVKGDECFSIKNNKGAKQTLQKFYYSKMQDEVDKIYTKVFEPSSASDTIYEGVEDFQSRKEELEETLQVVLSMRNRVLLPEEREVLKELSSEISNLL